MSKHPLRSATSQVNLGRTAKTNKMAPMLKDCIFAIVLVSPVLSGCSALDTEPNFDLGVGPASRTVCPGKKASYIVEVNEDIGVNLPVTLSSSPFGGSFVDNPVTPPAGSTLTVDTAGIPAGSHTITVTGTDGDRTHDATTRLEVLEVSPPFRSCFKPLTDDPLFRPIVQTRVRSGEIGDGDLPPVSNIAIWIQQFLTEEISSNQICAIGLDLEGAFPSRLGGRIRNVATGEDLPLSLLLDDQVVELFTGSDPDWTGVIVIPTATGIIPAGVRVRIEIEFPLQGIATCETTSLSLGSLVLAGTNSSEFVCAVDNERQYEPRNSCTDL